MVCVPCFIIPLLLFLWHKFVQPYVLRFWNPWAVKDADGNEVNEFPFKCEGGVCSFRKKIDQNKTDVSEKDAAEIVDSNKKQTQHKDSLEVKEDVRLKSE